MAEQGRRALTQDPLELNVNASAPDRSLGLGKVSNPQQSAGDADYQNTMGTIGAIGKVMGAVQEIYDGKKEEWQTEGKLKYLRGATEAEIDAEGNQYTKQGWQALNVSDQANKWYSSELTALQSGGYEKDPATFQKELMERRAAALKNLPDDPLQRKLYVAAFDDLGPRLVTQHTAAHNKYNQERSETKFGDDLDSTSTTAADASRMDGRAPIALSAGQVRTIPKDPTPTADRDVLIKTMLGEAAGEGATGLAAVAHVILNRLQDGKYGGTIRAVALAPKQFSTWNSGAGGNEPDRWEPDNPAYKQAAAIADAVLSGRHVDPTNGATHYFSPKGMVALAKGGTQSHLVPSWWPAKLKESNGEVIIGGHKFAGKARNGQVGGEAANAAIAGNARGADQAIIDMYKNTTDEQLKEQSESKAMTPEKQAEAKAVLLSRQGQVAGEATGKMEGDGSAAPRERGGELDKGSNSGAGTVPVGLKYGGSGAVEVTKDANPVAAAASVGVVTRETPSGPSSIVQNKIRNNPLLKPDVKGRIAGERMIQQLQAGNDQLYRDAGGIGILNELGTNSSVIRQVQTAYKQFQQGQLNKFNLDDQKWQASTVAAVSEGKSTVDEALALIDERKNQSRLSDDAAKSLAAKVQAEGIRVGKREVNDPELLGELASLYQQQQLGTMDAKKADMRVRELAKQFNVPVAQAAKMVHDVWQTDKSHWDSQKSKVIEAQKLAEQEAKDKARVAHALGQGFGLDNLPGAKHIRYTNAQGVVESLSPEQYGVAQIKDREYAAANEAIKKDVANNVPLDEAKARALATADSVIYGNLRKHGVVDEGLKSAMSAAFTGNILDKNGQVNKATMVAMDVWMRLSKDPNVGPEYMSKHFKDDKARILAMTAEELYVGDLDLGGALIKAQQVLAEQPKSSAGVSVLPALDETFTAKVGEHVTKRIREIQGGSYFGGSSYLGTQTEVGPSAIKSTSAGITSKAQQLKMMNPQMSDEVAIRIATQDRIDGSVMIGNNLVYGDPKKHQRLDEVAGVKGFGKDAMHRVVDSEVRARMQEATANYKAKGIDVSGWGKFGADNYWPSTEDYTTKTPPYWAAYDPTSEQIIIRPWKNEKMDEPADVPDYRINVRAAGEKWKKKQQGYGKSESPFTDIMNAIPNAVGKMGDTYRKAESAAKAGEAGARIGAMFGQE